MRDQSIRVVMADDNVRMRTRIRGALETGGCIVCGEGASAQEAIALTTEHRPDVALLDIHMPGNGITAAREITRHLPSTAVVMLSASAEDDDLFDSLRAGASGYLLKDTDPALLVEELGNVLDGNAAMSRRLVSRIMEEFRSPATPRFNRRSRASAKLSAREWEVIELLGDGLSTDDVARRLFVSPTTVRVHVSSVLHKLRVKDRESAFRVLREE